MILASKTHRSFPTARILRAATIMFRQEQTRNASLTMDTLNPLVKEVEYAVRGWMILSVSFDLQSFFQFFFLIRTGGDSCKRIRKATEGTYERYFFSI